MRPDTLAAQVVRGLLARTDLDPALLEDVILGCAYPEAAQGNNLARIVGLLAGLRHQVGGMTVNRFCGSSMQAVHIAAAQIEAGMGEAAENVAQRWNVSRADQEALAVGSHRKAAAARSEDRLRNEIVPVDTGAGTPIAEDGCIRPGTSP